MGLAYLLEPSFQIVDKSGNPLSNGYIEVYISGTSTKYYCYSDFGGSLHPFRIPLDALGSNIILASTELIYDVFIYNSFGTLVMSRHRVTPMASSTPTSGHSYIVVEGTEGQITVESSGSTDITYKVGLDDAIINELSGIHTDISSTSAYFENKINNLDIHNISIEQSGDGNAYTSFTKNGDVYTFRKEATYLPSANAPVVLAGENVEVSAANVNGQMQYTIKANPAGNVTNLISTDDSVSISATSAGNAVTYDLSVKDIAGENGAKNYAFLTSEMPVNTSEIALEYTDVQTNGIEWNTIDQRLEFSEDIKLIDLNFNVAYDIDEANGISYDNLILYIYSDGQVLEQQTFSIDTSKASHICKFNKKILDPSNLQFTVKVPKAGIVNASIEINDETFKSIGTGGGGGSTDIELYSSDGSLLISADGSAYDLKLNEQLSAKNYFLTNGNPHHPRSPASDGIVTFISTDEPITDLNSNTYQDDGWQTTEINIPKEMKLFNVKFKFTPYIQSPSQQPAYNYCSFGIYLDNTLVDNFQMVYDLSYNGSSQQLEKNCLIYNPMSADSTLTVEGSSGWYGWANIAINDETYRSIGTSGSGIPDNYDSLYSTVSSNSAAWNEGGGQGPTYSAGPNINITNNVISGRDWSNEINAKLDTSAFSLPNSANWDNTYDTVSSNSATWNNNSQIITHNQVASGTLEVNNNEYINVSGLDVSGVLTVKAMNTSVTNGEPITQCGGTLSFTTSPSAINFVDSTNSLLPKLDGVPTAFSGNAYQFTIINGIVACQEIK